MSLSGVIRQTSVWLLRVLLAFVATVSFFVWMPMLESKPISALPREGPYVEIPASAKSFRMDHGQIRFSTLGVPDEDPIRFGILVSVSIAAMLGLILSYRKS
jgi:hypothetical protein